MEAVLLDAGGVLTRLKAPRPVLFQEACVAQGIALPRERTEDLFAAMRQLREEEIDLFLGDYPRFRQRATALGRKLTGLGEAFERVWTDYRHLLQDPRHRALFDDAKPALEALAERDLRLGVLSNAVDALLPLLRRLGVADAFDAIIASAATGYEKPQREIFHLALDALGVEATEAVHVGDSYHFDYLGATRAGLRAILLDRRGRADVGVPRIRSLQELPEALDRETR